MFSYLSHDQDNKNEFSWVFSFQLNPNAICMYPEITTFKIAINPMVSDFFSSLVSVGESYHTTNSMIFLISTI